MNSPLFNPDVERALRVAMQAHAGQTRKGGEVPYATHPVHIALILQRLGVDSEVVQAALLHDVVEDCEDWTLERLAQEFSPAVVGWVGELTETKGEPWEVRKRQAVTKVPHMSEEAATIKGADKLHNLQTLVTALEESNDLQSVWKHFHGSPEHTIQIAEELIDALAKRISGPLTDELHATVARLRSLSGLADA